MPAVPKSSQVKSHINVDEFKAIIGDEHTLQRQCEEWLTVQRIPFIRVPDAIYKAIFGDRSVKPWLRAMISRFIKGLPDLTILQPGQEFNRALCIELKTAKGKPSQGQKNFAERVNVHLIRSFEDFEKLVNRFLDVQSL